MSHKPVVVLLDIETSPLKGYAWSTYQTNIIEVIEPSKVISCAWKELHGKMYCKALPDYQGYTAGEINDEGLVKTVWSVLDKADVVIGQNSDAFDIKRLNARFLYHKLPAPSAYQSIDTLRSAKKYFKFDSNSLNNLTKYLEEGEKAETGGFGLWTKCIAGDMDSWKKMKHYNAHDVELLERLYLRLLPYIGNHPNLSLIAGESDAACGSCMSKELIKRGFSYTLCGRKQRYQCSNCKSWTTGKYEYTKNAQRTDEDDES